MFGLSPQGKVECQMQLAVLTEAQLLEKRASRGGCLRLSPWMLVHQSTRLVRSSGPRAQVPNKYFVDVGGKDSAEELKEQDEKNGYLLDVPTYLGGDLPTKRRRSLDNCMLIWKMLSGSQTAPTAFPLSPHGRQDVRVDQVSKCVGVSLVHLVEPWYLYSGNFVKSFVMCI